MFNVTKYQRVVRDSGLNKSELAALFGVSRPTIYGWTTTPPRPGSISARMAEVITETIVTAMDKGILPFASLNPETRRARIKSMQRTLQNLKPAPAQ